MEWLATEQMTLALFITVIVIGVAVIIVGPWAIYKELSSWWWVMTKMKKRKNT